jgi:hypothetical protein
MCLRVIAKHVHINQHRHIGKKPAAAPVPSASTLELNHEESGQFMGDFIWFVVCG